ncbi:MAG TPA: alkaline phosphatase family protein [Blastocatellia bacterium]|nr:alkaline phosphatase family protein [Blastocatellia bacterium]
MSNKLLVIGLDGASFNVLDPLIEKSQLPNIARLIKGGARAELETTFPPITAVAWSSFMTGKNPGKHGIFEFVRRDQRSNRELAVNASFRQGRAIWDLLGDAGKRVIVHNFPCTYPPHEVNGLMIADFMTPKGKRDFSYPLSLLKEIEDKFGSYRLHLSQTYAEGNVEAVLDELFDELEYKAQVTEYLMTHYDWDAFFQYFWGTDRIQHELWHIIDESHPRHDKDESRLYRDRVYAYFRRVDEIIGRLIELAGGNEGERPLVLISSDHGFGPVHKYCSLNIWLLQQGFLKLKRDVMTRAKRLMFSMGVTPELAFKVVKKLPLGKLRPSRGVSSQPGASKLLGKVFLSFNDVDWNRSVAFSKGNYGQIYVNLAGREPNGVVSKDDYDRVCEQIVAGLREIEDPLTGKAWIGDVFRREEIYNGPLVGDAPDIAFLPADMRHLPLGNADFTSNRFMVDAFGISGCHRMNGVMIANGDPIKRDSKIEAQIYDIAPTLLYLLSQGVPEDMDGHVLSDAISEDFLNAHPIRFTSADESTESRELEFSPEENADVLERLKQLGYIG